MFDIGRDELRGLKGDDYLDGSQGVEVLFGGKVADVFQISKGVDLVEDFNIRQGDRIALDKRVNSRFIIILEVYSSWPMLRSSYSWMTFITMM